MRTLHILPAVLAARTQRSLESSVSHARGSYAASFSGVKHWAFSYDAQLVVRSGSGKFASKRRWLFYSKSRTGSRYSSIGWLSTCDSFGETY